MKVAQVTVDCGPSSKLESGQILENLTIVGNGKINTTVLPKPKIFIFPFLEMKWLKIAFK